MFPGQGNLSSRVHAGVALCSMGQLGGLGELGSYARGRIGAVLYARKSDDSPHSVYNYIPGHLVSPHTRCN